MNLLQLHQRPEVYFVVAAFLLATGIYGLVRRRTLIGMLIAGKTMVAMTPKATSNGCTTPKARRCCRCC